MLQSVIGKWCSYQKIFKCHYFIRLWSALLSLHRKIWKMLSISTCMPLGLSSALNWPTQGADKNVHLLGQHQHNELTHNTAFGLHRIQFSSSKTESRGLQRRLGFLGPLALPGIWKMIESSWIKSPGSWTIQGELKVGFKGCTLKSHPARVWGISRKYSYRLINISWWPVSRAVA